MGDWIGLVERARSLEGDLPSWLGELAAASAPLLGDGLGVAALGFRANGAGVEIEVVRASGGPADLAAVAVAANRVASAEAIERVYRSGITAACLSEVLPPGSRDDAVARASGGRFQDAIGIVACARPGHGLALSAPLLRRRRMTRDERTRWERVALHVAAGLRLRSALASVSLDGPSVEAVLETSGKVYDARGCAARGDARGRLRAAVRRAERARGPLRRRAPDEALALWEALVAGRWSLVDHFDTDGRRFVVAHRNEPGAGDPRGLSSRERQVAEQLGRGFAPKEIAYALGVAISTVAATLGGARLKLGLRSNADLAALFAPGGLCARFAEYEIAGESLAVASAALIDAGSLTSLSPAEREVTVLLAAGATAREVAVRRATAERTVANQMRSIYRKLGVTSRTELAARLARRAPGG